MEWCRRVRCARIYPAWAMNTCMLACSTTVGCIPGAADFTEGRSWLNKHMHTHDYIQDRVWELWELLFRF